MDGLGSRGLALFESLRSGDPSRDALALEAARTADRLDGLALLIDAEGVGAGPVAEARQQGLALSGLLKALGLGEAAQVVKAGPVEGRSPLELLQSKLQA